MKSFEFTMRILFFAALGVMIMFSGCKSKEKVAKAPGEELKPGSGDSQEKSHEQCKG